MLVSVVCIYNYDLNSEVDLYFGTPVTLKYRSLRSRETSVKLWLIASSVPRGVTWVGTKHLISTTVERIALFQFILTLHRG